MIQSIKHIDSFVTQNFTKEGLDNTSAGANCTSPTRMTEISHYTALGQYQT